MRSLRLAALPALFLGSAVAVAQPATPTDNPVPAPFRSYIAYDARVLSSNLATVDVKELEGFPAGSTVSMAELRAAKLIDSEKTFDGLRITGQGPLTKKLIVEADYYDFTADAAIRAAGGTPGINPTSRNRQDKMHCLVTENGLSPVVAIFAKQIPKSADEPLGKLLKAIQPLIPKYRGDRFASYVIFLRTEPGEKDAGDARRDKEFPDDDRTKEIEGSKPAQFEFAREKELEAIRGGNPMAVGGFAGAIDIPQIPFGLAASESKLTKAFSIPDDPEVITVVIYNRLFIVQSKSYKPDELTDDEIQKIVDLTTKTIEGLGK